MLVDETHTTAYKTFRAGKNPPQKAKKYRKYFQRRFKGPSQKMASLKVFAADIFRL